LAGLDDVHYVIVSQNGGDGVGTTAEGFAEDEDIGADVGLRLAFAVSGAGAITADAEQATGTAYASLDLIGDEEDVVLGTGIADVGYVASRRDENAGFTLDGLDEDAGDGRRIVGQ
jgi:hypothetical protein